VAIIGSWTPGSRFPGVPTSLLLPFVVGVSFLTIENFSVKSALGSTGDG
jgi:hypothetical protein